MHATSKPVGIAAAWLALVALMGNTPASQADVVADFYKGRTIQVVHHHCGLRVEIIRRDNVAARISRDLPGTEHEPLGRIRRHDM